MARWSRGGVPAASGLTSSLFSLTATLRRDDLIDEHPDNDLEDNPDNHLDAEDMDYIRTTSGHLQTGLHDFLVKR